MFKPKQLTKEGRELALNCGRFILQLQYWRDVKRNDFGYRFGYRHQFALISVSFAKYRWEWV